MSELYPLRLERTFERRLWGGRKLAAWLDLPQPWPIDLAESWQVYAENRVCNGALAGVTLAELAERFGGELIGSLGLHHYGHDFPLLAKFIDANDCLSIQVHPDDAYAHRVEAHTGFHGKTEAWYVLAAEPDASIIYGLRHASNRAEFAAVIEAGDVETLLNQVPVCAGDVIYVPAGTVHAINAGVLLFEIQQKSDLTYRVYDYGRCDAQGRQRELHLAKALDVIDYQPPAQSPIPPLVFRPDREVLIACPYFALERWRPQDEQWAQTRPTSFEIWTAVAGEAGVAGERLRVGESLVLPANLGSFVIDAAPAAALLRCYIPDINADLIEPLRALGYADERISQTVRSS